MDSQRPFLYLTLLFMLFLIWTTWQQDHAPKPPTTAASSVTSTANGDAAQQDVPTLGNLPALPTQESVPGAPAADAAAGQTLTVRTDTMILRINTRGGEVLEADLPTHPVSLDTPDKLVRILDSNGRNYVAQSGLQHLSVDGQDVKTLAPDHLATYTAPQMEYALVDGQDELVVPLTWQGANGLTVTKRFVFKRGSFLVNVEHEINNASPAMWSGTEYRQLKHGHVDSGNMLFGIYAYTGGSYYRDGAYGKLSFGDMQDKNLNETVTGGWVAMQEHYFLSAWIPPRDETSQYYSMVNQVQGVKGYVLGMRSPILQVAPGATGTFSTGFYVGPKNQDVLESIASGLDLTVDYGIFAFISKPIFWTMQVIHGVVGNWGWTIIFLTLFIKLLFFYPSAMSYKSMAKMKAVAPKIKDINERFANDAQGKQKAMMDIYRKEKINPLGGCLPILIQIPVFMGLYWVLLESVELRQAPWLLWYKDLSIMDPYFVLPLIMGASMWVQQKLNPPPADPMQQKIFQFMPIIFTVMFLWFPAGLVLYWVVNNLLSIAQQWYINKKIVGHA